MGFFKKFKNQDQESETDGNRSNSPVLPRLTKPRAVIPKPHSQGPEVGSHLSPPAKQKAPPSPTYSGDRKPKIPPPPPLILKAAAASLPPRPKSPKITELQRHYPSHSLYPDLPPAIEVDLSPRATNLQPISPRKCFTKKVKSFTDIISKFAKSPSSQELNVKLSPSARSVGDPRSNSNLAYLRISATSITRQTKENRHHVDEEELNMILDEDLPRPPSSLIDTVLSAYYDLDTMPSPPGSLCDE